MGRIRCRQGYFELKRVEGERNEVVFMLNSVRM